MAKDKHLMYADSNCPVCTRSVMKIFLSMCIGILLGYSVHNLCSWMKTYEISSTTFSVKFNWGDKVMVDGEEIETLKWFDDVLTAGNIKNNLMTLTAKPHVAGTAGNRDLAELIYKQWKEYNFDKVELLNYTVLTSYPNSTARNFLKLMDGSEVIYEAHTNGESPLTPGEDDPDVIAPYLAYSDNGSVTGPLVYVNYGRIEDFFYLTRNLSLNLTGHICITRYGEIFRGDKALQAQNFNCSGLVIYSDPKDYAPSGVPVYPNGPSLPPSGVQRGSLMRKEGDPLTPEVPSIDGFFRQPYSNAEEKGYVAKIPAQPISYEDAVHFMSELDAIPAPPDWIGGLNISYNILQRSSNSTKYVHLEVNDVLEQRTIYNVIANIYGGVEADRTVMLGNHRDAWVFGAADPNSGTAVLMELARAFSELRQTGWRPGRTIMLCSWDAEEFAMIGSTEFMEDRHKVLEKNTVAYLNVDIALAGSQYLGVGGTPLIFEAVWQATQLVKSPDPGFDTVYDQWLAAFSKTYNGTLKPQIFNLGSGSDYVMYLQELGITCLDLAYANSTAGRYLYAVYHSIHDNFYWMTHFGDPTFTHHLALGLVWIKVAVMLSTQPILMFDPRDYPITVKGIYDDVEKEYGKLLMEQGISLDYLKGAVDDFNSASVNFYTKLQDVVSHTDVYSNENVIRIINDKLMNIERAFIHGSGLPERPYFKHVLFAPSSVNSYGSSLFPGVSDTIFNAINFGGSWDEVKRQLDIVRNHIRFATEVMNEPSLDYAPLN